MIGAITSPVGLAFCIAGGIGELSLERISRAIAPLIIVEAAVPALITHFPEVVMLLSGRKVRNAAASVIG
jgi:TRAP-type C4-dicarboxylate transport system permease large subunit